MGKKLPNIIILKKALINKNIPSVKKRNKINNNNQFRKKKKNKHKHKKKKRNKSSILPSQNKDKFLNQTINQLFNNKIDEEKPKWMSIETKTIQNMDERFNEEIYEYVNYIIPKNDSLFQRINTKKILTNIIKKIQPQWKVILYGSFIQNTSTIFSDLDFAIVNNDNNSSRKIDINDLICIMKILRHHGFSKNIRLIRARIPILKATCCFTKIDVDISIKKPNGLEADRLIWRILKKDKILKPSIIILKILLKKYELNNAQIGGMNSFLLFHLVYFYYIIYNKRNERIIYNNLNNSDIDMNEDEKENNSSYNNSYIANNYSNNKKNDFNYDYNSDEDKENINDLNNENKLIISKPMSLFNKGDNLTDESKSMENINSLNNSEEDNKNYESFMMYNNINNCNDNNENEEQDLDEDEDEDEDDDEVEDEDGGEDKYNEHLLNQYINKEEDKNNDENNCDIGNFIFTFLKFYGKEFDYEQLGFSLNENNFGNTFFKVERTDMKYNNYLCVESIKDKSFDVGRSCYLYPKIVNLFRATYDIIKLEKQKNTCSILLSLGFPTI